MDCVAVVKKYIIVISQKAEQCLRLEFEIGLNSLQRTNIYCCVSKGNRTRMNTGASGPPRLCLASSRHISTRPWLHLELKVI